MTLIGPADLDTARDDGRARARPRGSLAYLPAELTIEALRDWLTRALRPPAGWHLDTFERFGDGRDEACALTFVDGGDRHRYRIRAQRDLSTRPRTILAEISNGVLRVPHLTPTEVEDVWVALCAFARKLDEPDELEQAADWLRLLLDACDVLDRYSLRPDERHDALMALKRRGEFTRLDALTVIHDPSIWPQRPACLLDRLTGEYWVRAGEARTFLLYIVGVQPLTHTRLRSRWHEIGVDRQHFEDRRPPHPKANLYRVPDGFLTS
jgi:hypothetical protein